MIVAIREIIDIIVVCIIILAIAVRYKKKIRQKRCRVPTLGILVNWD